jgi:Domain of unknown function (DUF4294)
MIRRVAILLFFTLTAISGARAQLSANDTIRVGVISVDGIDRPVILLPESAVNATYFDDDDRKRRNELRNNVFVVYPYAIAAAAILKDVNANLDKLDGRRDRKKYLKSIDKTLDAAFKEPLKNLSIDQGHILIKLIDRQTGQNCYSIIKELKGGFSAMIWQSVGVFFNNNLARDYDPEGADRELETFVKDLETSNAYQYQLYQQQQLMKKIAKQK